MLKASLVCALVAAGCSSSNTPDPVNGAPTITSVTASPSLGVAGLTTVTLSATASDPDGDPLTYRWTVNGTSDTSDKTAWTFTPSGEVLQLTATVTVTDPKGLTASKTSDPIVIGSLTHRWAVTSSELPGFVLFYLSLTQNGQSVTGSILTADGTFGTQGTASGTIDAAGRVRGLRCVFTPASGGADVTIDADLGIAAGLTLTGSIVATNGATINGRAILGWPVRFAIG